MLITYASFLRAWVERSRIHIQKTILPNYLVSVGGLLYRCSVLTEATNRDQSRQQKEWTNKHPVMNQWTARPPSVGFPSGQVLDFRLPRKQCKTHISIVKRQFMYMDAYPPGERVLTGAVKQTELRVDCWHPYARMYVKSLKKGNSYYFSLSLYFPIHSPAGNVSKVAGTVESNSFDAGLLSNHRQWKLSKQKESVYNTKPRLAS